MGDIEKHFFLWEDENSDRILWVGFHSLSIVIGIGIGTCKLYNISYRVKFNLSEKHNKFYTILLFAW